MLIPIFFALLVGHHQISAVINKVSLQYKINDSIVAENRISNLYKPLADDYGPLFNSMYEKLNPVYGPPELTGDHRVPQIFDQPPPEQPPPMYNSPILFSSYNSLNKPEPQYSLPKSTLKSLPILPKLNYNVPQSEFSPPKSEYSLPISQYNSLKSEYSSLKFSYGSPFSSLRPPKSEFDTPSNFQSILMPQYNLPSSTSRPISLFYESLIPLSIEAYGPPIKKSIVQFHSNLQKNYDFPSLIQTPVQQQYGISVSTNLYNLPPSSLSGIPAPPTPPDIKYDGWQPITGISGASDKQPPCIENYNLPIPSNNYQPPIKYDHLLNNKEQGNQYTSGNGHLMPILSNSNIPSDSYGTPLNNPEDHSLKSSVSQSTTSHESSGLPPPALPQFEPLHNNQPAIESSSSNNIDHHDLIDPYTESNVNSLSVEKTVGIEFLTNSGPLISSHGNSQTSNSYHKSDIEGSYSLDHNGLSLQQLPVISSENYDSLLPTKMYSLASPSFSSDSFFSVSNSVHGSSFPSTNLFDFSFHKNNGYHRNRNNGGYRTSPPVPSHFIPPQRPSMKFRESVPVRLLTNLNQYLFPNKPYKIYGPSSIKNQQSSGKQNILLQGQSNSFSSSNSVGKSNTFNIRTALAAPNANYGIPLSFNNFNTPAPTLIYGAPNFATASSLGTGVNLYNSDQTTLIPTYGIPALVAFEYDCNKNRDRLQYDFGNSDLLQSNGPNNQNSSDIHIEKKFSKNLNANSEKSMSSISNSLSTFQSTTIVNDLELLDYKENRNSSKVSYGNPIDTYELFNQSTTELTTHKHTSSNTVSDKSSHSQSSLLEGLLNQGLVGISVNSLTDTSTAQSSSESQKSRPSTEVDATQFIKSDEGAQTLALAETLTVDGDGFKIEGSKGTYNLQIEPVDVGYGNDNSESIKHHQVLSNGLLQNILAAIEQQSVSSEQFKLQGIS